MTWLVVDLPTPTWKNDGVKVSWDDYSIPNMIGKSESSHVPNHQPEQRFETCAVQNLGKKMGQAGHNEENQPGTAVFLSFRSWYSVQLGLFWADSWFDHLAVFWALWACHASESLQVDVTFYVARKANRFDWKFMGKSKFDGWSSFSSLKKQSMEGIRYTVPRVQTHPNYCSKPSVMTILDNCSVYSPPIIIKQQGLNTAPSQMIVL